MLSPFADVIDAWLRAELLLKGAVIHERLVEQYGFTGNYQRVKFYLQEARPRIAAEMGIPRTDWAGCTAGSSGSRCAGVGRLGR
ncbi:hypothetical protein [Micromonospora echinaurantiaca]|uniref:hypothetical protein n=1 Tax=Micromonospora echinaurantiaca TaxID=47857 RepID=UPI0015604809|nr:hypothetical protein [Micromonospora echinaurantiaca]